MSATKLPIIYGLTGKAEGSYGGGGALSTATDGIQLADIAIPSVAYANDGTRRPPPAIGGHQRRVVPSGPAITVPFKHEAKGAAAAYTASGGATGESSIRRMLKACGFDVAVDITGGSEKETFTPTPGGAGASFSSMVFDCYGDQQKFPITGAYADLKISADGPEVPLWEFMFSGLLGTVADVTVPAITYPTLTTDPPKSSNVAFTLGLFTAAKLRKWSFALNRTLTPRLDQNGAGHGGFSPGRRAPVLEVTVEATALQANPYNASGAIDPYQLYANASLLDCSLQIGSVQYNKWKLTPGKVQLMAPPVEEPDASGVLWTLQLQCNPTTLNGNDDVTFLLN